MMISRLAFASVALLVATVAHASNWVLNPSLYYMSNTDTSDSVRTDYTNTWINATVAYKFGNTIGLGVKYLDNQTETKSGGTWTTSDVSGMGLTVGYYGKTPGPVFAASYLYNGMTKTASLGGTTSEVSYYGGTAYMVDIAYRWGSNNISFGPQLSYIKMTYSTMKTTLGTSETTTDLVGEWGDTWLVPYVGVWAEF